MTDSFAKPALTIDQQIAHLRGKGMAIKDEARARYWLPMSAITGSAPIGSILNIRKGRMGPAFAVAPASIQSLRCTISTECCAAW